MRITAIAFVLTFLSATLQGQALNEQLKIVHLTGDFYIYQSYNLYQGERISANGMYLVTENGVVLFDTPWEASQFQPLLDSIKARHNKSVVLCIPTHFHDDRTAGLSYFRSKGIKTYSTVLTDDLCKKTQRNRAEFLITKDSLFNVGNYSFETYYPGQGHSPDNIVIWFKKQRILYGACLIKSWEDKDLGYLGDANKTEYAATVKRVQLKCPQPRYVIVGHGDWSSVTSLSHTLEMALALKKKSKEP